MGHNCQKGAGKSRPEAQGGGVPDAQPVLRRHDQSRQRRRGVQRRRVHRRLRRGRRAPLETQRVDAPVRRDREQDRAVQLRSQDLRRGVLGACPRSDAKRRPRGGAGD